MGVGRGTEEQGQEWGGPDKESERARRVDGKMQPLGVVVLRDLVKS